MALPAEAKQWAVKRLLKGTPPLQVLQLLLDNGYTFEASQAALGESVRQARCPRDRQFYEKLASPPLWQKAGAMSEQGLSVLQQDKAQILCWDGFLTAVECNRIIELAKTQLRPSTIAADTVKIIDKDFSDFRTSTTCDLPFLEQDEVAVLDQKIIQAMQLGVGEKEMIQAQHYAVGQEFKAHTDYFEPGTKEYKHFAKKRGQRTWTFMIYLNEGCEGGETEFPHLDLSFTPKTGRALIWNNLNPDGTPNPNTLHQAHPVSSGEKVVITKWFREKD